MEKKFVKGDREYLVSVSFYAYWGSKANFRVDLKTRLKGKRKWNGFIGPNRYFYRGIDVGKHEEYRKDCILSEIPQEWIDEVKQMEIDRISKSEYSY